jgi:hypothetical protein
VSPTPAFEGTILERGRAAADDLPAELVYAGFSLGGNARADAGPDAAGHPRRVVVSRGASALRIRPLLAPGRPARGAQAAIAIFAQAEQSPVKVPFQTFDNKAIVVFDKHDSSLLALRLACCWARWVARGQLTKDLDAIDYGRVKALIESGRQGLATVSKIKTALNGSKTQVDRALSHVEALVIEVEAVLQGLESELG